MRDRLNAAYRKCPFLVKKEEKALHTCCANSVRLLQFYFLNYILFLYFLNYIYRRTGPDQTERSFAVKGVFFQLFPMGSKHFACCWCVLVSSHFRFESASFFCRSALNASGWKTFNSQQKSTQCQFFSYCPIRWTERQVFCVTTKFTAAWKQQSWRRH